MTNSSAHTLNPSLAIIFPGQGSQSIGMLAGLASEYTEIKLTFEEASEVLRYDLWTLAQNGPEEDLNRTDRTQAIMFTAGVSLWRTWLSQGGPTPAFMAGHSLGEYTALGCSDAVEFAAALRLVEKRGLLMQEAVPKGIGAMAAILGLDSATVIELCEKAKNDEVVSAVNFNSPQQIVVAGHTAAVERVMDLAKETGAKRTVLLPVSVPSHCKLMEEAAKKFSKFLDATPLETPKISVISNADVHVYERSAAIRRGLVKQLHSPVRWVETIQYLASHGVSTILECGPGKVLVGLNKRIDKTITALPMQDPASFEKAMETSLKN